VVERSRNVSLEVGCKLSEEARKEKSVIRMKVRKTMAFKVMSLSSG
jgi:hypothetical protein